MRIRKKNGENNIRSICLKVLRVGIVVSGVKILGFWEYVLVRLRCFGVWVGVRSGYLVG